MLVKITAQLPKEVQEGLSMIEDLSHVSPFRLAPGRIASFLCFAWVIHEIEEDYDASRSAPMFPLEIDCR